MKLLNTLFLVYGPLFLGAGAIDFDHAAEGSCNSPVVVKASID